jgi:hypothetical protein
MINAMQIRTAISVIMSLFFLWNCSTPSVPDKKIVLRLEPSAENPRNSEGDFIKLKDGRILFIYTHFTGGSGDNATANLASRISSDNGQSWSDYDGHVLANEGDMNIMSVSLIRLNKNTIALFYLRKNSEIDCIPFMRLSRDEGKSWSEAKQCIEQPGYYVMNNDRVVVLSNGRILLPVALHQSPEMQRSRGAKIMCYYSDNQGNSWERSDLVPNPQEIVLQEPGIVQMKDGRIMMFCRSDAGSQHITFSSDQGLTWLPIQPSKIVSPMSPASIERIPSTGDLLLLWNKNYEEGNPDGGIRTPFTLAVSRDEGKTWEKVKYVESDPLGWYCYTAIEFTDDGVLLGHCAGNRREHNGLETTQITWLSTEWIYKDPTPKPIVASDKNGSIELSCPESDAEIYFTLDSNPPTKSSKRYKEPIKVNKTTPLTMQAFHPNMTPSEIVSVNVGVDVYQEAPAIAADLSPGLFCNYYEGETSRVDKIKELSLVHKFVVPAFSIETRKRDENFAFKYSGYIKIPEDGIYTFYLSSNDGSRLYLNEDVFIDNDGPHGIREISNAMALRKGDYPIELSYFQWGGGLGLKLSWKGPGFEKTEIPASVLFHTEL